MSMKRRDFLKGAALGSAAIATSTTAGIAVADEVAAVGSGQMYYSTGVNWLPEAPVIDDVEIVEVKNYDVVVVGAGHAGTQAGLAAAEAGASVAVLESTPEDMYRPLGGEMGVWNSKYMQEAFGLAEYNLGDVIDEFQKRALGYVNPMIIASYVNNSGEMFDNLVSILHETEEGTATLDREVFFTHEQKDYATGTARTEYPIHCGGWRSWCSDAQFQGEISHETIQGVASRSKLPIVAQCVRDKAASLGAEWHFETTGVLLTQNEAGDVTGVIAKNAEGNYVKYEANKGVIVATGDFCNDPDMVWGLLPDIAEWYMRSGMTLEQAKESWFGFSGRTGTGHKMCCWAGGLIEELPGRGAMNQGGGVSGPWGTAPFLWLNKDGVRFCNEASSQTNKGNCARQPFGLMALFTDAKWEQSVCAAGVEHGGPNYGRPVYYEELADDMNAAAAAGAEGYPCRSVCIIERSTTQVYSAQTIEELAAILGYDEETIPTVVESINRYNELCYAGVDTDFGKNIEAMIPVDEPPFFGVIGDNGACTSVGLVTLCGMVTDEKQNVLDANRKPIKGLYVAGNTLGGRYGLAYSTPTGGNSIGMALTHGRLAGKLVASL